MSEDWRISLEVVVACFILALSGLAVSAMYSSLSAEKRANTTLKSDTEHYKRSIAEYARREAELEGALSTAQERALTAESATRTASARFDEYRRGVIGRDSAIRERVATCIDGLDTSSRGLDQCIGLVDICISIDKLVEPGAY